MSKSYKTKDKVEDNKKSSSATGTGATKQAKFQRKLSMVEQIARGQIPTIFPNNGPGYQSNIGEWLTEMTPVLRRDFDEVLVNALLNPAAGVILPVVLAVVLLPVPATQQMEGQRRNETDADYQQRMQAHEQLMQPIREQIAHATATNEMRIADYREARKINAQRIERIRTQRPALFTFLLNATSEKGRARLMNDPDWPALRDGVQATNTAGGTNFVSLWILMTRIFEVESNRSKEPAELRVASENALSNVQMHASEIYNIQRYRNRFDQLVAEYNRHLAANEPRKSDAVLSIYFINGLHPSKFSSLLDHLKKEKLVNADPNRNVMPQTLQAAHELAQNWLTAKQSGLDSQRIHNDQRVGPTVFYTGEPKVGDTKESAFAGVHQGSKQKKKKNYTSNQIATTTAGSDSREGSDKVCTHCNKKGHTYMECYKLIRAMRAKTLPDDKKGGFDEEPSFIGVCVESSKSTIEESPKLGKVFTTEAAKTLPPGFIAWDSGCSVKGIFCTRSLLEFVTKADNPLSVDGIGGHQTNLELVGPMRALKAIGDIYWKPDGIINVFGQAPLENIADIVYQQKQSRYRVKFQDTFEPMFFKRHKGLYVCDALAWIKNEERRRLKSREYALIETTTDREKQFTKRELARAHVARELQEKLSFMSNRKMSQLLNSGEVLECPITFKDVQRADYIWGKSVPYLKGRTHARKTKSPIMELNSGWAAPQNVQAGQICHADCFFVEKRKFLLSCAEPLGIIQVTDLNHNYGQQVLLEAISKHMNNLSFRGFRVEKLKIDPEAALVALKDKIEQMFQIDIDVSGTNNHVPLAENKIKLIKECVRSHLFSLPWELPYSLLPRLINYVVRNLNITPSGTREDGYTPFLGFTGNKINYKRDLRLKFGEYVQAIEPSTDNSMNERTVGAIALGPVGNNVGSYKFLSLSTGRVFNRDHWTMLPTPPIVIEFINNACAKQKHRITKDPVFKYSNGIHVQIDNKDDDHDPSNDFHPEVVDISDEAFVSDSEQQETEEQLLEFHDVTLPNEDIDKGETLENLYEDSDEAVVQEHFEGNNIVESVSDVITAHQYNTRTRSGAMTRKDYNAMDFGLHITLSKALRSRSEAAINAITDELMQMLIKKVWKPRQWRTLSSQEKSKVIISSMFLKENFLPSGEFDKMKARLVGGGHQQDRTIYDVSETSSPTVSINSVMMTTAIAAMEHRKVYTIDIAGAYLNAKLKQKVHMRIQKLLADKLVELQPTYDAYRCVDGSIVVELEKALYGCVESAKLWFEELRRFHLAEGFTQNSYDECVFNKTTTEGKQLTVCAYVDDLLVTCVDKDAIDVYVSRLRDVYREITINSSNKHSYLGMTLDFSKSECCNLTMEKYIEDLLRIYQVTGTATTPASTNLFITRDNIELLTEDMQEVFHSRVAKLLYLAKRVRLDILTAITYLTTRVNKANSDDWKKLERVLKYINGTRSLSLCLRIGSTLNVSTFIDASYAVHPDFRSHTGSVVRVGKATVQCKSSKQKLTAKSTAESELVGMSDHVPNGIWTDNWLRSQGYKIPTAVVYQDNQAAIKLATNGKACSERTRHINIRYFFIKDRITNGELQVKYIASSDMLADMFTKPLQGALFRYMRDVVMGQESEHATIYGT